MSWKNEGNELFETASAKCPCCGASITFNEKLGKLICEYCGSVYDPDGLKPSGRFDICDADEAGSEEENKLEFICDSCGAAVVTDQNTSATFCAFCGSPTLIRRRLTKSFRPDLIIPFKISKEQAISSFREWAKEHKGVPKKFTSDATLTKITGYYIPFWLIDADCNTSVGGVGQIDKDDKISRYSVDRDIRFRARRVPFDGCKKISDLLMEAIEPFDYDDIKYYNDMYLPGFYAQRYDKSALEMLDLIQIRLDAYSESIAKYFTAKEYTSVSVKPGFCYAENFSQNYALMPVWFLNVEYEGSSYSIAVNGQTGKASGVLPVSRKSIEAKAKFKALLPALIYGAFTTILAVIITLLSSGIFQGLGFGYFVIVFLLVLFLSGIPAVPFLIPAEVRAFSSMRLDDLITIGSAPDAAEYVDYRVKIEMENRDSFLSTVQKGQEQN